MPDNTDLIVNKLEQIEQRLSKLEGSRVLESLPIDANGKAIAVIQHDDEPSAPIGSIISLIIGGLILLFNVPSFLSRYLFYSYQNSYSSGYDFFSVILISLGVILVVVGIRGISKNRKERASGVVHKKVATFQPTNTLEIKNAVDALQKEVPKAKPEDSIEYQIASHWFSIVGIVAILLGVVFFLKYAFDNHLIGPAGQVSIGIIFGLVLLAAGEIFRTKYAKYSQIITGGGLGVLYLSVWAAYGVFHLLDANILLFGMSLITICAALLAVRYNALAIAVIAVIGGFVTPAVLSGGIENQMLLLSYVVILNLGVLFVALFKNWRSLNILTFISTYFVFTVWYGNHYDPTKLLTTLIFLTILFVIFSFVWVVYNLIYKKAVEEQDILLMVLNAVVYFGFSYSLLSKNYADTLGFFAFALAVYYFVFGYIAYTKFKAESALTLGLLGISIIFLTVAVPFQVKKNLITLIWTVEAAVILWLGFWLSSYKLRVAALGIYVLVVIRLIFFDSIVPLAEFQLLINRRFFTYITAAVSAAIASWFYWKNKDKTLAEENVILPALLIGLNVILVVSLTLESFSYFDKKIDVVQKHAQVNTVLGAKIAKFVISDTKDDSSDKCTPASLNEVYIGFDATCTPPKGLTAKFVFRNVNLAKGTKIDNALLTLTPADPYPGVTVYKVAVRNSSSPNFEATSLPISINVLDWPVQSWNYLYPVSTPNIGTLVQDVVNDPYWTSGANIEVLVGTNKVDSLRRVFAYERDNSKAASLILTYESADNNSVQDQPYYQNNNLNNYQNNYRAVPTPPIYQNTYQTNYNSYQPDPAVQKEIKNLTGERNFSISIIWLLYSLTLIVIGVVTKYKPIRLSALVFFAITILKVFLIDSSNLAQIYRIVAFIGLGTILLVVAYIYQRYKDKINAFLL